MFDNKTVIIVGAGASVEVGLPIGDHLKGIISNKLNYQYDHNNDRWISGDGLISDAFRIVESENSDDKNFGRCKESASLIHGALPMAISIDHFINSHKDNKSVEMCGKLAIVLSILEAEKHSKLWIDPLKQGQTMDFSRLDDTWFNGFWKLLTEDASIDDIPKRLSNITFIVFNYDRCIEQYLFHALQKFYNIDYVEAAQIVNDLEIFHPYGTVGSLVWSKGNNSVKFGHLPSSKQLVDLATGIKTFTEGIDEDSSDILRIRNALKESTMVLYLGFAFHRLNLELLSSSDRESHKMNGAKYYSTAYKMSDSDCASVKISLNRMFGVPESTIELDKKLTCSLLFQEYGRSLSLG